MTTLSVSVADRAHIQVFSTDRGETYRWRLLAGNNRELGRAATTYDEFEDCVRAAKTAATWLPGAQPQVRSVGGRWEWRVVADGECVATSGTTFDRRPRCVAGYRLFQRHLTAFDLRLTRALSDRCSP